MGFSVVDNLPSKIFLIFVNVSNNDVLFFSEYDKYITPNRKKLRITENNTNFVSFNAKKNTNLSCIQVDDAAYATNNWTAIDDAATQQCSCLYE